MSDPIAEAARCIRASRRLLVFTGAGISAESGIPTFRDDEGFWRRFPPERFATWQGLASTALRRPQEFAEFVQAVVEPIARATPNAAHRALAAAEKHASITVATQNIDGLHQDAGSSVVHEIHGSFFETIYRSGRRRSLLTRRDLLDVADRLAGARRGPLVLPRAFWAMRRFAGIGLGGLFYPKLVMFGDAMAEPAWSEALEAARNADCVLQIGCSGFVLPAAMLPYAARKNGAPILVVDPHEAEGDVYLRGTAVEIVPKLFERAFGNRDAG